LRDFSLPHRQSIAVLLNLNTLQYFSFSSQEPFNYGGRFLYERMVSRAHVLFVLALASSSLLINTPTSGAVSSTAKPRAFYFTGTLSSQRPTGTLSSQRPTGSTSSTSNLTLSPTFALQPFLTSTTISGQLTYSVWATWSGNTSMSLPSVQISASFSYKLAAQNWNNITSSEQPITRGPAPAPYNVSLSVQLPSLPELTTVAVGISASHVPRNANVTLVWGSVDQSSFVELPLSGYITLIQSNPVNIVDSTGIPIQYFQLNAANNLVEVKTFASSALGQNDISRVNMTIVDPSLHPVRKADMLYVQFNPGSPPFEYVATWTYPSNSTQGTYQVWIDIIDAQGNLAYSYRTASFQLVPPGYIPPPYNLIPYFLIAGVAGAGGGALYYRRRKRKSYLVPFDHFNAMTGGGLDGGTVVTIEGNTGSGKTLLSEQLLYEDLRSGKPCVFVNTGDFPNNIRSKMKTLGFDVSGYEQSGQLTFVDGYSAEAGQESREKVSVPSLGDLTTLGMKISSALPPSSFKGGSLYFDSLSPLVSKAKPESIVSFVQSIGARVKGLSGKAFFTVGPGIDGSVQRQLEESADCIVQMEAFEERGSRKRRLRIAKNRARTHQEGWTEFTIEDGKGIIFYSRKSST